MPMPSPPQDQAAAPARAARKSDIGLEKPFWREKGLKDMTAAEWESLCDGCGRCCLVKLEDEETGTVYFTDITCKLLDASTCRCTDYANRRRRVRDCIKLTPDSAQSLSWLPPTCAYRLIAEGRDLAWWHPLVSGRQETVHEAGISVRGRVSLSEKQVRLADYPNHIVAWPGKRPRPRRHGPPRASDPKVGTGFGKIRCSNKE